MYQKYWQNIIFIFFFSKEFRIWSEWICIHTFKQELHVLTFAQKFSNCGLVACTILTLQTSKQWLIFSSSFTVRWLNSTVHKIVERNKKDFICLAYLAHTTAIPCNFASWALLKVYWCKTPVTSRLDCWVVGDANIRFLANDFFSCNTKHD